LHNEELRKLFLELLYQLVCAVQAEDNKASSVEKRMFFMERYLEIESFETTKSDYSQGF
jgi:hypothetical protein